MLLNKIPEIIKAGIDIQPTVTKQKFLWIFDKEEKLVTFSQDNTFASTCTKRGGSFVRSDESRFECGEASFAVEGFSACLGSSCGVTPSIKDTSRGNAAIAARFREKMRNADKLEESGVESGVKCTSMSGALSASVGIALGAMLAVVWHLI
jgi:hypothetical protein